MSDHHGNPDEHTHEDLARDGGGALDGGDFTAEMDDSEAEADETSGATGGGRVSED